MLLLTLLSWSLPNATDEMGVEVAFPIAEGLSMVSTITIWTEEIGLQFHICENLLSTGLPRHTQELTRQTYWISARGRGYG